MAGRNMSPYATALAQVAAHRVKVCSRPTMSTGFQRMVAASPTIAASGKHRHVAWLHPHPPTTLRTCGLVHVTANQITRPAVARPGTSQGHRRRRRRRLRWAGLGSKVREHST